METSNRQHREMKRASESRAGVPATSSDRPLSGSFLVRLWLESGAGEGAQPVLRGYCRHLQTGEEHYFSDAHSLGSSLSSQLQQGRSHAALKEVSR